MNITKEQMLEWLDNAHAGCPDYHDIKVAIRALIESSGEKESEYRPSVAMSSRPIMDPSYFPAPSPASMPDLSYLNTGIPEKYLKPAPLPAEVEEEPTQYRCEGCGRFFDEKITSHARSVDDGHGNEIPVECGPITKVPATSPAPTDLTPTDTEMQGHFDRGEMNDPAPLPKEADVQNSIHLSKSVEEAMRELEGCITCDDSIVDNDRIAALAVIKSALSKGVEWERRYAELVEDISRRTDQARTMEVKP